jgi:hypothetical protein
MNKSVIAIASSEAHANTILNSLRASGFSDPDISMVANRPGTSRGVVHEASTKGPEGATAGALSGGALGGTVGVLAGIGLLAIPGVGPFIAAGPILAALSGVAVGATIGGVAGGLVGLGIPEIEAKALEARLYMGEILMAVHVTNADRITRAKEVFERAEATGVSVVGEQPPPEPEQHLGA